MINFKRKKEEKNFFQSSAGNKPNKGFAGKKDEKRAHSLVLRQKYGQVVAAGLGKFACAQRCRK